MNENGNQILKPEMTSKGALLFILWFDPLEKLPNGQSGQSTEKAGKVTGYYHVKYRSPNDARSKASH